MCNDSSNSDGCQQGQMFNYVAGTCLPCSGGVAIANQPTSGTHSSQPNNTGAKIITYGNAAADIFTKIWGAVKGNKNTGGNNGAYGGDGAPTVEESGMKYVWYIMGAIILIVLGTFVYKIIKK